MANGAGSWFKGIAVTSPILLAAVASVFLVASSIANPADDPEVVFTPPEDSGGGGVTDRIEITAKDIYLDFLQDLEESNNQYLGESIKITGVVATWGLDYNLQPVLTIYSDSFGNDKIVCQWFQHFDEEGMPDLIGKEIILLGVCDGLQDGFLYFHNCSSEIVPTKTPIEDLD